MSGTASALIGVFGVLSGLVVERLLRSLGRLRCVASLSSPLVLTGIEEEPGYPRSVLLEQAAETTEAKGVYYECTIDLFNGKEVPTGLRDVRVELVRDNDEPLRDVPQDLGTNRVGTLYPGIPGAVGAGTDALGVINLPPRQIVHKELQGNFGREAADALATGKWSKLEFVGELPARPFLGLLGSKTYRKTITEP